jgi:acyl dehydratase
MGAALLLIKTPAGRLSSRHPESATEVSMSPADPAERPLFHLEDLTPGVRFTTGTVRVTREDILAFAGAYDPQPFHLDDAAADAHPVFKGLSASGWQTASLTMRLLTTTAPRLAGGVIGMGGEVSWPRPVRPGDELTVHAEVAEQRRSQSRPDRGIVTLRCETKNQRGEVVQQLLARLLVFARGAGEGA